MFCKLVLQILEAIALKERERSMNICGCTMQPNFLQPNLLRKSTEHFSDSDAEIQASVSTSSGKTTQSAHETKRTKFLEKFSNIKLPSSSTKCTHASSKSNSIDLSMPGYINNLKINSKPLSFQVCFLRFYIRLVFVITVFIYNVEAM